MSSLTIPNPKNNWLYFPTYENIVYVMIIRDQPVEKLSQACSEVKNYLNLKTFEWGYDSQTVKIWTDREELPKVYEMVNRMILHGYKVIIYDGSAVEVSPNDYPFNSRKQEQMLISSIERYEKQKIETPSYFNIAIHRTAFWKSLQGQELAKKLRQKYLLIDSPDLDYPSTSEYWGELFQPAEIVGNNING